MTWPFENDTSAITKKLAKRNLKADKSRNILIIITIALATCLIMTTTLYFFASQRKSLNDAAGRYQAIINEVDNDTITKLVNDSRVQVGVSHLLGLVSYGDYKLTVRSMDETLMKLFVIAAVTALFVYLCVMIAVIKPAKIAAHVTPIEAVRYMASNNDVMFSYFILMLAVQMLFSYLAIRQIKKQSLVDQIRELS